MVKLYLDAFYQNQSMSGSLFLAPGGSAQMRGFATGVGSKADMGGPITGDISEDGAGLSTPARSSSLGPMRLAGGLIPF